MFARLWYFASKALASVRESPGISALAAGTIGASLLVLGLYTMALQNLEGLALVWGRSASIAVYIDDRVPAEGWPVIRDQLQGMDGVAQARLVTPLEALERFRARGPQASALVEGITEEVLPAAVELSLQSGFTDLDNLATIAKRAQALPGVSSVDYGQEEFERLRALLDVLRWGGLLAGLLLVLSTAFIVSNTIRLTVYARRDEIAILRLVGATAWFVRAPFLIEGGLWGLVGGIGGVALMWSADVMLAPRISVAVSDVLGGLEVHLFATDIGVALVIAGITMGVVGSGLAVRRFLDLEAI